MFWRMTRQLVPLVNMYVRHCGKVTLIDLLDKAQDALPSGIRYARNHSPSTWPGPQDQRVEQLLAGLSKELYIPAIDLETGRVSCSARKVGEGADFSCRSRLFRRFHLILAPYELKGAIT